MADLADGESTEVEGSGSAVYTLKNTGGVYSCSCPAWRNQSIAIERRTCKHLRRLRGDGEERARTGGEALPAPKKDDGDKPPLLLAQRWESHVDLTGWWLSEKLDGVRAFWNGEAFISRLGNPFVAPDWFVEGLPKTPLDGELWGGRKKFQRTVGIVKRQDKSALWREVSFLVFDAPDHGGVFEERVAHCRELVAGIGDHVSLVEHARCDGAAHLLAELARVEALGGEGLMARQPRSRYEAGRSATLLKLKSFCDAEARVVGHTAGAGRHKGRTGALVVELADGTRFNVGTGLSDAERRAPPPIGSLITFRYQELSDGGVPRFPSYVAMRDDAEGPSALDASPPKHAANRNAATRNAAAKPRDEAVAPAAGERYFELVDGKSSKFWAIAQSGNGYQARYGRIGSKGQSTKKELASVAAAEAACAKLIAEKTAKGYVER